MTSKLKVEQIAHTNNVSAMAIDSSGRVNRSVIPSWRLKVSNTGNQELTSAGPHTITFQNLTAANTRCHLDGGCTLSGGIVTVPVTGTYALNCAVRFNGVGSGYVLVQITINGVATSVEELYLIRGTSNHPGDYDTLAGSTVMKLTANDNVRTTIYTSADTSYNVDGHSEFSGYLIG